MRDRRDDQSGVDEDDPILTQLKAEPLAISMPGAQTIPLVLASPHAGRCYPQSFAAQSRLSPLNLRRSEDAYVDLLFSQAVRLGAPLIAARFPRALLDVNRAPNELDPEMFDGPLGVPVDASSPRVHSGLGVIPRIVRDGADIYRGRLPARAAFERLAQFHQPYHAALTRLIEVTRRRFGFAVLLDCHSMPSAAAAPDVILGDRYGLSAAPAVIRAAERAFHAHGFRVVRNIPYPGGYTTQLHGRPATGAHALQIEINRALYLDEEHVAPTAKFATLQGRLAAVLEDFAARMGTSRREAAE